MRFPRAAESQCVACPQIVRPRGRKNVAEFDMFCIGEGIASGKHVTQTPDQSAQTDEKVDLKKVKMVDSFVLSFDVVT